MKTVPDFWFESRLWIDGEWSPGAAAIDVRNPATGEVLADVALAGEEEVVRAIEGAARAGRSWAARPAAERAVILEKVASLLASRRDEFARLISAEQGKTCDQAAAEVDYAASFFQWYGEQARRLQGRIVPHPEAGREFLLELLPIGVAGLITPWNFPLAQGAKKLAAALAAGCSAIWKPSEFTPLVALGMAPVLQQAGVPDGVIQIVPGEGPVVGAVLAGRPEVGVLSLTGSTQTGRLLMEAAARQIKRVSLELGGNAPFVVLPDADLEFVADELLKLKLLVAGQVCVTANRIFVPAELEEQLADLLVERLRTVQVGNGLAEGVGMGPLIHAAACSKVATLVDRAVEGGATLVEQNRSFENDPSLVGGSFFPPTVLVGVTDAMEIAREEIFGPVLPLLRYQSVDEVVRRANQTPYGLAAYVYGGDLSQCRAVAGALEVGIVGVNEWRPLKAEIPFGGFKQSGIGREGGEEGIGEFLETRVISMPRRVLGSPG